MNLETRNPASDRKRDPSKKKTCSGILQRPAQRRQCEGLSSRRREFGSSLHGRPRDSWRTPSLRNEFEEAVANFGGYAIRQLECAGIDAAVRHQLPFGQIGFIKAALGEESYEPDFRTGSPVFIVASGYTINGDVEDLVAWSPHIPRKWWLRFGNGYCLGEPGSTLIHVDMSQFLRDGAVGCLPLMVNNG